MRRGSVTWAPCTYMYVVRVCIKIRKVQYHHAVSLRSQQHSFPFKKGSTRAMQAPQEDGRDRHPTAQRRCFRRQRRRRHVRAAGRFEGTTATAAPWIALLGGFDAAACANEDAHKPAAKRAAEVDSREQTRAISANASLFSPLCGEGPPRTFAHLCRQYHIVARQALFFCLRCSTGSISHQTLRFCGTLVGKLCTLGHAGAIARAWLPLAVSDLLLSTSGASAAASPGSGRHRALLAAVPLPCLDSLVVAIVRLVSLRGAAGAPPRTPRAEYVATSSPLLSGPIVGEVLPFLFGGCLRREEDIIIIGQHTQRCQYIFTRTLLAQKALQRKTLSLVIDFLGRSDAADEYAVSNSCANHAVVRTTPKASLLALEAATYLAGVWADMTFVSRTDFAQHKYVTLALCDMLRQCSKSQLVDEDGRVRARCPRRPGAHVPFGRSVLSRLLAGIQLHLESTVPNIAVLGNSVAAVVFNVLEPGNNTFECTVACMSAVPNVGADVCWDQWWSSHHLEDGGSVHGDCGGRGNSEATNAKGHTTSRWDMGTEGSVVCGADTECSFLDPWDSGLPHDGQDAAEQDEPNFGRGKGSNLINPAARARNDVSLDAYLLADEEADLTNGGIPVHLRECEAFLLSGVDADRTLFESPRSHISRHT